jgi:hypothetical protein
MTDWFARRVLHLTDVEVSLCFYVNRLGFISPWRYKEDGTARVAQGGAAGLHAHPGRRAAGEDWQGADVHFRERREGDARGRDRPR